MKRLAPHAAILICNMYVVFYAIDRVNTAMNFIDNPLTKGLLLILCVDGIYCWRQLTKPAPRKTAKADHASSVQPAPVRKPVPELENAASVEVPFSRKAARLARQRAEAERAGKGAAS